MRAAAAGALVAALLTAAPAWAAPPAAPGCPGDCAGDGAVTIDDLIKGVGIALGSQPLSACTAMDTSGSGGVTIDELIRAVTAALGGCPPAATATETMPASPTETATVPTPTESETPTLSPSPTPPPPTPTATSIPTTARFCDLPGSVQYGGPGVSIVPGGPAEASDLSFLNLPIGFCAHFFAKVGNVRQLRFAPGGELFIASPTRNTTGGGQNGQAAILILPDDDGDGAADQVIPFLSGISATQGLLFTGGYFYYQAGDGGGTCDSGDQQGRTWGRRIMRRPYAAGDRAPSEPAEQVADINLYCSSLHWPKAMDVDDQGTIYVANGGDESEPCLASRPFHGGILKLDPNAPDGFTQVARGFRNPISLRCARGHDMCFAIELTRDYTTPVGGREKLLPIREGDDWGFPCCATKSKAFPDINPVPDCSMVSQEIDSFFVGNTPFDLDFESGRWPEPWKDHVFVPQHGAYGTWKGARVVAIDFDAMTGQVLPGSDLSGQSTGAMVDFATGWDDGTRAHGRPANVAFAPDGRLFLGNDNSGDIIWIAPLDLPTP